MGAARQIRKTAKEEEKQGHWLQRGLNERVNLGRARRLPTLMSFSEQPPGYSSSPPPHHRESPPSCELCRRPGSSSGWCGPPVLRQSRAGGAERQAQGEGGVCLSPLCPAVQLGARLSQYHLELSE